MWDKYEYELYVCLYVVLLDFYGCVIDYGKFSDLIIDIYDFAVL